MNKITDITRSKIKSLFVEGVKEYYWGDQFTLHEYVWYGKLSPVDFLNKLYDLRSMPSCDSRLSNVEEEIIMHSRLGDEPYNNDNWIFGDRRFPVVSGSDKDYLDFLCQVFNPCVGAGDQYLLEKINSYLKCDGYELYVCDKISGENIYSWRNLTELEIVSNSFVPFCLRRKDLVSSKIRISRDLRNRISAIIEKYDSREYFTTETGYNYLGDISVEAFNELKLCCEPKAYINDKYVLVDNAKDLIENNGQWFVVFSYIELYHKLVNNEVYVFDINRVLEQLGFKLFYGKIDVSSNVVPKIEMSLTTEETLKDLIINAEMLFKSDKQIAIEKLWDALERIKTFLADDKKKSAKLLVENMSCGVKGLFEILNNEFKQLTDIGNCYQIRHFEKGKIAITDGRLREYWFRRCSALLNLAVQFV